MSTQEDSSNQNNKNSKEVINASLEWTKQITTLSSGTLVLSATFIKDIFTGVVEWHWVLISSWGFFALSALAGVCFMGNICFLFSSKNQEPKLIYNRVTLLIARVQLIAFIIGLACFVLFASHNFLRNGEQVNTNIQATEKAPINSAP